MPLTINRANKPVEPLPYTILDALHELAGGHKGVLMLVRKSDGSCYRVKAFDPKTSMVTLSKPGHRRSAAIPIGQREAALYEPRWRG